MGNFQRSPVFKIFEESSWMDSQKLLHLISQAEQITGRQLYNTQDNISVAMVRHIAMWTCMPKANQFWRLFIPHRRNH